MKFTVSHVFLSFTIMVSLFACNASANEPVTLVESNIWSTVTVNSNTPNQTNTFTNIDLDDNVNMLVVALPGETADITSIHFGGSPLTLTKYFVQSTYAKVHIFTLSDPDVSAGQTLTIVSSNSTPNIDGGYSPQIYAFSNTSSIEDTPEAGSSSAATVTLDFGSVTQGSYLLMTATGQNTANPIYESPAVDLSGLNGGTGGWSSRTAGETISANAGAKTVDVTASDRVAVIGIEILPPPAPPAGTVITIK